MRSVISNDLSHSTFGCIVRCTLTPKTNMKQRSNQTRGILVEALQSIDENIDLGKIDSARSVLAFMSGYIGRSEPAIAEMLDKVLSKIN